MCTYSIIDINIYFELFVEVFIVPISHVNILEILFSKMDPEKCFPRWFVDCCVCGRDNSAAK